MGYRFDKVGDQEQKIAQTLKQIKLELGIIPVELSQEEQSLQLVRKNSLKQSIKHSEQATDYNFANRFAACQEYIQQSEQEQQQNLSLIQQLSSSSCQQVELENPPSKIVGESNLLEKEFVRTEQKINPKDIRPMPILKKSLKLIMKKWRSGLVNYEYIQNQFKAILQDISV